jgi:hypothetical protein
MIMKTAENEGGNDSKIFSLLGHIRSAISQNNPQQLQWIMQSNIRSYWANRHWFVIYDKASEHFGIIQVIVKHLHV